MVYFRKELAIIFMVYGIVYTNAAIGTSENINLISPTKLLFQFGARVLIPDDNILIADEQCFEIGLHCTVLDHPKLVHGSRIRFRGYVQTDFDVRTQRARISPRVSASCLPGQTSRIIIPFSSFLDCRASYVLHSSSSSSYF